MNDSQIASSSTSEIARAPHDQLPSAEDRLAALEKKMPSMAESRFLRFGAIAGVLGTLISIGTGALTLYSGTVRQQSEDHQKVVHQFDEYMQRVLVDDKK